jgi:polysaccharide export outer membrane protein
MVWGQNPPVSGSSGPQPTIAELPPPPAGAGTSLPAAGVDNRTYDIGPGDIVRVNVFRQPDFTDNHSVRPDGKITVPLVGDVQAAGLTPDRLGAQLAQGLSEWVESPVVTVSVLQVNSKRYTVSGMAMRIGQFAMPTPVRVGAALDLAGFQQFADKKDVIIMRETGERIHFNYKDYVDGKNLDKNIFLQNGDTILVRE